VIDRVGGGSRMAHAGGAVSLFVFCLISVGVFAVGLATVVTSWSIERAEPVLPPARAGGLPPLPRPRLVIEWRRLAIGLGMVLGAAPPLIGTALAFLLEADPNARGMGVCFALLVAVSAFGMALVWSRSRR
jgi:hypothetical protein